MNTRRLFRCAFYFLVIAFASIPGMAVSAQQPTPSDDEVNLIARQLFCPICQNTPLDVCPTQACHDWRELIRQMLAQGKTSVEIKQYFVDHYGARVLSEPPLTGFNWLTYIVPAVAFLIGIFILVKAFQFWKHRPKTPVVSVDNQPRPMAGDDYISRLEDELRKRK